MSFEFETAYLNGLGQVSGSSRHTGICFTEDLTLGVNLELIWIPGGSFLMGAAPAVPGMMLQQIADPRFVLRMMQRMGMMTWDFELFAKM
jgi:formylglycine-generating enzyme required for sulfatase activity